MGFLGDWTVRGHLGLGIASMVWLGAGLAGCVDEVPPPAKLENFNAAAHNGYYAFGWAYDGQGVQLFSSESQGIKIHANDVTNTGHVMAMGGEWHIEFARFQEAAGKPFQDGGIAGNLHEHGATGVGDTSIPEVHADMAAWGTANVTIGDKPLPDPVTGNATWLAHYMVISTGVRDDTTHQIWNQAKSAPYDPSNAADGYAQPEDYEIHLVLKPNKAPDGNFTPSKKLAEVTQAITDVEYDANHTLFENALPGTTVNLTITLTADPTAGATELVFNVKDPSGQSIKQVTLGGQPGNTATASFNLDVAKFGAYKVQVTGRGVNAKYSIAGAMKAPTPERALVNFWWEDVLLGAAAEAVELGAGGGHPGHH